MQNISVTVEQSFPRFDRKIRRVTILFFGFKQVDEFEKYNVSIFHDIVNVYLKYSSIDTDSSINQTSVKLLMFFMAFGII